MFINCVSVRGRGGGVLKSQLRYEVKNSQIINCTSIDNKECEFSECQKSKLRSSDFELSK